MNIKQIVAAGLCAAALGGFSQAQAAFPDHPLKIVVPFPPGGTSDSVARVLAKGMEDQLGQPVIVDNKSGAGTIIGTQYVAHSRPDGYTILWATTPFAINDSLYRKKLPYNTLKDFKFVIDVVQVPLVLIVRADSPYKSVADLVKAAKAQPGKLTFSSSGVGGSPHLATELFASMEKIKATHVPYQGSAPSVMSMLAGQTNFVFDTLFLTYPQVQGGKARALAQTGTVRSPLLPDVPTLAEVGLKGYEATSWLSLAVPSGTPPAVIDKLNAAANKALQSAQFQDVLSKQGVRIVGGTPQAADQHLRVEIEKWSRVVQESGAKVQ